MHAKRLRQLQFNWKVGCSSARLIWRGLTCKATRRRIPSCALHSDHSFYAFSEYTASSLPHLRCRSRTPVPPAAAGGWTLPKSPRSPPLCPRSEHSGNTSKRKGAPSITCWLHSHQKRNDHHHLHLFKINRRADVTHRVWGGRNRVPRVSFVHLIFRAHNFATASAILLCRETTQNHTCVQEKQHVIQS